MLVCHRHEEAMARRQLSERAGGGKLLCRLMVTGVNVCTVLGALAKGAAWLHVGAMIFI